MNFIHDRTVTVEDESITDLLKDLRDESVIMARQQVELAKTEMSEKFSTMVKNSISAVVAGAILYTGLLFLLASLTFLGYVGLVNAGVGLATAIWLAPLITAVVLGIIGGILLAKALTTLKHTNMVPEKTVQSLKEDKQWLTKKRT